MAGGWGERPVDVEVDGVRFTSGLVDHRQGGAFTLAKSADMLAAYEPILAGLDHPRMVELGIAYGGSVAWFTVRLRPRKLVAIEYSPERVGVLDRFIAERGLGETVRPYFGVDQGDRARVAGILADELAGEPLDLVVDDASHRYEPTLASFETIFPLLRPGGLFVIEDWAGLHHLAAAFARRMAETAGTPEGDALVASIDERVRSGEGAETSLLRLAVELALVEASGSGIVDEVSVNRHWIAVRRGGEALEPGRFRLADCYTDDFGLVRP